jgi:hypothetical protein
MLTYAECDYYNDKHWERFSKFGIMLDSGAFSMAKSGKKLDLIEYCEYIKLRKPAKYISMDVIGNPEQSELNLLEMVKQDLDPIPVFHAGSDFKFLQRLVDMGYTYICLGGTVGQKNPQRIEFFDTVFAKYPEIKFHGLGMTSLELLKRYNFYSVDSTTWLIPDRAGRYIGPDDTQIPAPEGMSKDERYRITIGRMLDIANATT